MQVWVLVEEPDEIHGDYGYPIGVYASEAQANAALAAWWKGHDNCAGPDEDEDGWCLECGKSADVDGPHEVQGLEGA